MDGGALTGPDNSGGIVGDCTAYSLIRSGMSDSLDAISRDARRQPGDPRSAAACIVDAIRTRIEDRRLATGERLPSIRTLALRAGASRHAVVEAYERLIAHGYLSAQRGSGFYVGEGHRRPVPPALPEHRDGYDVAWLIREVLEASDDWLKVGGPWLPDDWLDVPALQHAIRSLGRGEPSHLLRYGRPLGYLPLRKELASLLDRLGIEAETDQLLTTNGSSHAFDLIIRTLLRPGMPALVEDPGYYNLFGFLRSQGVRLIGVPRRTDGPDLDALRAQAMRHDAHVFFTQTALQNPTGSDTAPAVAHRLLALARELDLTIVEDDTYADLDAEPVPRLATLDQLDRVIYLRSFSKSLSGSLRVGFIAASRARIDAFANMKVLSAISTSPFTERLVYRLIESGHYGAFLRRVRQRIAAARAEALKLLRGAGMEVFVEPRGANFLWARFPGIDHAKALSERARSQGVILGIGDVFRPNLEPSAWMRFNVALCGDPRLARLLNQVS
jgi:DNA-binding transcriptional MocR family regulator